MKITALFIVANRELSLVAGISTVGKTDFDRFIQNSELMFADRKLVSVITFTLFLFLITDL